MLPLPERRFGRAARTYPASSSRWREPALMRVGEPSAAAARLRADPLTEVRATWACDEVGVLPELGGSSSFCFLSELTVGPVRRCRAGRKDDDRDCSIVPRNCWQTSEPWTGTDPTDYAPT